MPTSDGEPVARAGVRRGAAVDRRVRAATLQVLDERGYRDLTMEGVAAAAGVAKTSVYRRFPSRAALVGAVLADLVTAGAAGPPPPAGVARPLTGADLLATGRRVARVLTDPVAAGAVLGVLLEADDAEVAAVRASLVTHPAPGPDGTPATDPATDAVAGAVLLRALVLRLPVGEDYLHELVGRIRPTAAPEETR